MKPASISMRRATCAPSTRPQSHAAKSYRSASSSARIRSTRYRPRCEIPVDELGLVGSLRGGTLPVVKCRTNDIRVPADAELVIEGYLDDKGYSEKEGPYGEYLGYYGVVKQNPVFHVTAITHRKDAVFQTATISGGHMDMTDTLCRGRSRVARGWPRERGRRASRGDGRQCGDDPLQQRDKLPELPRHRR